jgi:hypothetical protein
MMASESSQLVHTGPFFLFDLIAVYASPYSMQQEQLLLAAPLSLFDGCVCDAPHV